MNTPIVIVEPTAEPLTLDECRQHLRVVAYEADDSDSDADGTHPDDALIMALQAAAREHVENYTGLSLTTRTLQIAMDSFPTVAVDESAVIDLPSGPVQSIVEITTGEPTSDTDEADFVVDSTTYALDLYRSPQRLVPSSTWPTITAATNTIKVTYVAGYAIAGDDEDTGRPLPAALRAALLLVLGHLYEHREDNAEDALESIPLGAEVLMRPMLVRLGMA
jgi:uncharacterized phiE125 gp8 family phage protein